MVFIRCRGIWIGVFVLGVVDQDQVEFGDEAGEVVAIFLWDEIKDTGLLVLRCRVRPGMTNRSLGRRFLAGGFELPDNEVGDVKARGEVFGGGVAYEEVGNLDVEVWPLFDLLDPGIVGIEIGESDDTPAFQDLNLVAQLRLSADGHPEELRERTGADDSGFLGLNQGHDLGRIAFEQMFAKEALRELPVGGQLLLGLEQCVNPGDAAVDGFVFDTVAGGGVVLHNFSCAASVVEVKLVVHCIAGLARSDAVVGDDLADGRFGEDGQEEGNERACGNEADRFSDDVKRNGTDVVFGRNRRRHPFTGLLNLPLHSQPQRRRLLRLEASVVRTLAPLVVGLWILDIAA